ncbi:MAG: hypothetical protein SGBAC_008223 [Bacillariaceae sp.]
MDPTISRDLDAFKAWTEENGVLLADGLDLSSSPSGDWLISLSKPINEAQVLMTIPKDLRLSSTTVRDELGSDVVEAVEYLKSKKLDEQSHQFYLWIRVLQEYEKGEASKWHGWMKSLPRSFNSAVCMDEEELECLPPFAWSLAKMVRFHHEAFLEAINMIEDSVLGDGTKDDKEVLLWAFNVVFTRCWGKEDFDDKNRHDLVPMGDMFNHGDPPNTFIDYDEVTDDCHIILKEDVDPSTPLKLSYGHSRVPSKFLSVFGFVDESQSEIFCQMLVADPTKRHVEVGYDTDKMLFDTRDGTIADVIFDVTLYSILEQVPELQEKFYKAHVDKDKEAKDFLRQQYHLETCIMIKNHIDSSLRIFEEVLQKCVNLNPEEHPRLETIYKHNLFFHQTFHKAQGKINAMIKEEMMQRKKRENSVAAT